MAEVPGRMTRPGARYKWAALGVLALAQLMVVLDTTIVNVALPSIQRALHFSSAANLQWVVNAYILAFGGFLLLGGRVADRFGRRRVFVAGVALFVIGSLAGGLAESSSLLVAARAVQGLGGAFMAPAALSLVTVIFTGRGMGFHGAAMPMEPVSTTLSSSVIHTSVHTSASGAALVAIILPLTPLKVQSWYAVPGLMVLPAFSLLSHLPAEYPPMTNRSGSTMNVATSVARVVLA